MEFSALYHSCESNYCYATKNHEVKLILRTKKDDDIKRIFVVYNTKYLFLKEQKEVEMKEKLQTAFNDFYFIYLPLEDVRLGYVFKIVTNDDKTYYFSENRVIDYKPDFIEYNLDYFQLPYINFNDVVCVNKKFSSRVFYQIFVDRFFNGEEKQINGKINVVWGENDNIKSDTFAGGNLKGITKKLDYLKDLGIDTIYLTPIFESRSNHKYETYDYYKIAKDFGDETTFKELVEEAHKRDILIVLDGVFNHIAFYSPIFEDVIKNGKNSKYYSWFIVHNDEETIDIENKNYESFGFARYMPKLNLSVKEVQDYVIDICKHYLINYHIDGYRLDVGDEISHTFFKRLKYELKEIDENIFLISENWHDGHATIDDGCECDSLMNYPFTSAVLDLLGHQRIDEKEFVNRINLLLVRYKDASLHNMLNLLDSHDKPRFINEVNFDEAKALIGYSLLFLYPGIPMVYYGTEIGLDGNNDPDCRKMFIWDETKWDKVRFIFIKSFIELHKKLDINNENNEFNINYLSDLNILKVIVNNKYTKEVVINELINLKNDEIDISSFSKDKEVLLANNYKEFKLNKNGFIIYR